MRKIILNLAVSLDGYIAAPDGDVQWIQDNTTDDKNGKSMQIFKQFLSTIDVIIMGKKAYEITSSFAPISEQFPNKKIIVQSHNNIDDVITSDQSIEQLVANTAGNIWVFGGGNSIKQFLDADLIDELQISIIPVILGEGIPLFLPTKFSKWKLISYRDFSGILSIKYQRK